jgi:hypothetical protein
MQRSHGLCLPFCCSLPTHTTLRRAIAVVIKGLCSSSRVVRWGGRAKVCRPVRAWFVVVGHDLSMSQPVGSS